MSDVKTDDPVSHEPGPWRMAPSSRCYHAISADQWDQLASVVTRMDDETEDSPAGLANARLIAAAPELLAACKALHHAMDVMLAWRIEHEHGFMPSKLPQWSAVVAAHAAITKAEGRS